MDFTKQKDNIVGLGGKWVDNETNSLLVDIGFGYKPIYNLVQFFDLLTPFCSRKTILSKITNYKKSLGSLQPEEIEDIFRNIDLIDDIFQCEEINKNKFIDLIKPELEQGNVIDLTGFKYLDKIKETFQKETFIYSALDCIDVEYKGFLIKFDEKYFIKKNKYNLISTCDKKYIFYIMINNRICYPTNDNYQSSWFVKEKENA